MYCDGPLNKKTLLVMFLTFFEKNVLFHMKQISILNNVAFCFENQFETGEKCGKMQFA